MKYYLSILKQTGPPLCLVAICVLVGFTLFWAGAAVYAVFSTTQVEATVIEQADEYEYALQYKAPDGTTRTDSIQTGDLTVGEVITIRAGHQSLGVNAPQRYGANLAICGVLALVYLGFYYLLKKIPD